jgi:formate dehydrogenase iron-sulfur subunit
MSDSFLIAALLDEQADLSAVERFTQRHAETTEPSLSRHYRDLVPLSAPRPGEQYAFAVDLDACTGCKACVTACHNLNGLDPDESWRRVGTLVGDVHGAAVLQSVTMACHHCADPGCLRGCPVAAYEKDTVTGIVRHLDDQCIGCRYCVMMCPYDVPQYSPSRGIVRKCDMCHGRLAAGEAPACVQSCPNEAIRIRVVPTETAPTIAIADAPDARLTRPTTRYRSERGTSSWSAVDAARATPAESHEPLVVMLVATQLAVGLFAAALVTTGWLGHGARVSATAGGLVLLAALAVSVLHLGRPLRAWRVFLGLGTSWLSREIVAFGVTAVLAGGYVASCWLADPAEPTSVVLGIAAVAAGLLAIGCSAMIYHATGRALWRVGWSAGQFFGTTAVLGAAAVGLLARSAAPSARVAAAAGIVVVVTALKLIALAVLHHEQRDGLPLVRTARLLRGPLQSLTAFRGLVALVGGIVLPVVALGTPTFPAALLAFLLLLVGESIERLLFFRAVSPARMPGAL